MSQSHRQLFIFFTSFSIDNRSWSVSPVSTTDHVDTSVRPFIQEKILTARGSSKALVLTHGGSRVNKLQAKTKCQILQHHQYNTHKWLNQFWRHWYRVTAQWLSSTLFRRSHQRCSVKGVPENFANFTGKHLCQSLFLKKLQAFRSVTLLKRNSNTGVFLWNLRNF